MGTTSLGGRAEGQALADAKADEVAALSWAELDAYGERVEAVTAPSGRPFRVKSRTSWDMKPWESGMNVSVKAYTASGLRRIWGYKAWRTRGSTDDPVPEPPPT